MGTEVTPHGGRLDDIQPSPPISKSEFETIQPLIRARLLDLQRQLESAPFSVLVVLGGVDGAGKTESLSLLNEWMDPRWIRSNAYGSPPDGDRPPAWRYWRDLPPAGQIGIFLSSWYSSPLLRHVKQDRNTGAFDAALAEIERNERLLTNGGTLIVKYWLHHDKEGQKQQLRALETDPATAWRVGGDAWENWHLYDDFVASTNHMIEATSTERSPWILLDGSDRRGRSMALTQHLADTIERRLHTPDQGKGHDATVTSRPAPDTPGSGGDGVGPEAPDALAGVDLRRTIERDEYQHRLREGQSRLNRLQRRAHEAGISTLLAFEGWDAAGKGGTIRRIIQAVDPRQYRVVPIAAPNEEERSHHYLWRFWRHLPEAGHMTIFDRSWYGRVLVERVEGFASEEDWQRAYSEIVHFERQLTDHGTVVAKFWLHLSPEEQLARFEARAATPHKAWKLTDEDWRNRDRWDDYAAAVNDMVDRTHTSTAPWTLVPADQKRLARVITIEAVCDQLDARLNESGR